MTLLLHGLARTANLLRLLQVACIGLILLAVNTLLYPVQQHGDWLQHVFCELFPHS